MSEMAKKARAQMKAKASSLAHGDPHQKVDASSWTEAEPLNANYQTGMKPISRTKFKRGGKVVKVHGEHERVRADRKPRGKPTVIDSWLNRDVKRANEERPDGDKHVGGYRRGGRAHKMDGGSFVPTARMAFTSGPSQMSRAAGYKHGGHPDEAEDKKLIKSMVKKAAIKPGKRHGGEILHAHDCPCAKCTGGRSERKHGGRADAHWIKGAIKHPGALHKSLHVPEGEKIPVKKLKKAEHSTNKLVAKRAHLAETLRSLHKSKGGMSVSDGTLEGTRPTGGRLARKSGGKTGKGKMNVNVIIAPEHHVPGDSMGMGGPGPMAGHPQLGNLMAAMPPQMPLGAMSPAGMPPRPYPPMPTPGQGAPMPMARKRGGRAYEAGAGSGLGRLEKIEEYGDQ